MGAGLRDRKKMQTRAHIANTAWTLFADRGFDHVTVRDVARLAGVSEATVFNYFRTKEDLFFHRLEEYGERLVSEIRNRASGESVLSAFRRFLFEPAGLIAQADSGDPVAWDRLRTVNRLIAESPALRARESLSFTRTADALGAELACGADPDDRPRACIEAAVAAEALVAVQRALVAHVRKIVLDEQASPNLSADVLTLGSDAFALLERGLSEYGRDS